MDLLALLLSFVAVTSFGVAAIVAVEGAVAAARTRIRATAPLPASTAVSTGELPCPPCSAAA